MKYLSFVAKREIDCVNSDAVEYFGYAFDCVTTVASLSSA